MTAIVTCSSTATRTFRLVTTRPLPAGGLDDVRDVVPRTLHVHRGGGRVLAHGGFSPHVGAVPVVPGGRGPRSVVGSVADDPVTERCDNTLLHKDKDLSTSRLFSKSVPDDKHSNTQCINQRHRERLGGRGVRECTEKEHGKNLACFAFIVAWSSRLGDGV